MVNVAYHGLYGRFTTTEKSEIATLMSADSLVGDEFEPIIDRSGTQTHIWLQNRFGGRVGLLDVATAEAVQLAKAKDWISHILLASVWQNQGTSATAWGEVIFIAYPVAKVQPYDVFVQGIANLLKQGIRPEIALAQNSLEQIESSGGTWLPTGRKALPAHEGSVLIKDQLSLNEKMVEGARKRNPGCLAAGWLFIATLIILAFFLIKGLFGL